MSAVPSGTVPFAGSPAPGAGGWSVGNALGGLGDIAGLIGGIGQQDQTNAALQSLTGGLNSMIGSQTGETNTLFGAYNQALPGLQQLISQAQGQGMQANTAGLGAAGQLQGMASQLGQQSPYTAQQAGVAGQLQNFNGLQPAQIAELSTQAGDAGLSAARTMAAQSGGVANPALLAQQQASNAGQTTMQTATALGSQAMQAQLAGLQSAGGLYGQAANQNLAGQQAAAGAVQGAGNLYSNIGSNDLSASLQGTGQLGQGLQTGMSGLNNSIGTYAQLLGQTQQAASQQSNPFATALGSLGSLAPLAGLAL